jgi:hypothetical protein
MAPRSNRRFAEDRGSIPKSSSPVVHLDNARLVTKRLVTCEPVISGSPNHGRSGSNL